MYTISWDEKARDFSRKLPKDIAWRIFRKVDSIKEEPFHYIERLAEIGGYKLRIGDYRIILDIDQARKTIEVRLIGHRRNVYKDLQ